MFDLTDTRRPLSDAERLDWLRLARSEGVGPVIFRQLLQRFGTAKRALEALPDLSRRGGRQRAIQVFPADRALAEIAAAQAIGARHLASLRYSSSETKFSRPSSNLERRRQDTSSVEALPSQMISASSWPNAGACITPCPEEPLMQ